MPPVASPPGVTLLDLLDERRMTQTYLAFATGYSLKHINQIIKGRVRITAAVALRLEAELGTPARFWLIRQADYDLAMARRHLCQ